MCLCHVQVMIHQRESEELHSVVEDLEKYNLHVMSQLFECTVDDLKISRSVATLKETWELLGQLM